ncbi:RNA recognition motif. family protein [Cryptosporidium muris RN66]|uniref:RNA recognition motif. family protein n=1 Tax=Cryptosporidium muris (strain RN66) TaxID=441375 RepID=B6AI37_CRYMR|nr:RNA recognition motif. family protein [Cryptosporidium muris RN66]EEA07878.1 RNA recognition motif. family protein [Cryptosporidium muris RN66]|eukprot:XP_002142227.1 RNA recognition motif. family protein [Cryptosporidium muris RN66]
MLDDDVTEKNSINGSEQLNVYNSSTSNNSDESPKKKEDSNSANEEETENSGVDNGRVDISKGEKIESPKEIYHIPRRRSRSPSTDNNDKEESNTGRSISPLRSDDSSRKKRRRGSSGWDAPFNPDVSQLMPNMKQANVGQMMGSSNIAPRQVTQGARIYVGSLDYSLSEADLRQVFGSFGTIVNIDMPREGNRSKGFCFIEYTTQESAEMALATMNRFVLKGRPIKVGRPTNAIVSNNQNNNNSMGNHTGMVGMPVLPPENTNANIPPHQIPQNPPQNRIYIGSVPYSFTPDDLRHIFKAFGVILSCQLIPSVEKPGTHRGYGFIEFGTPDQAKLAIETMNGFEVGGKQLKVNVATALKPSNSISSNQIPIVSPTLQNVMSQQIPPTLAIPPTMAIPPVLSMPNVTPLPPNLYQPPNIPVPYPANSYPIIPNSTSNSNVILLTNMIGPEEVDDELKEEVKIECSKYGKVYDVRIHISDHVSKPSDRVRIFVVFETNTMAQIAVPALNNRWFGGNQVYCRLYNTERFYSSFYDD